MTTSPLSVPIATAEQFKKALLALRDKNLPDTHLEMLRTQCRMPGSTITATQLAECAKYHNYNAANLQYGTLASKIAGYLNFQPEKRADGTPRWWTALSYTVNGMQDPDTGHFQFIMRPELVTALREMRWA